MLGDKTFLQNMMDAELREFTENHKVTYESVTEPLDLQGAGSFLIELNSSSTAFQKVLDEKFRETIANMSCRHTDTYKSQLGEKIIKLDESRTIDEAISLVHKTSLLVKERFAGTIFVINTGALINPLHPLVALELLKNRFKYRVSKILIYSYKNLVSISSDYGSVDPSTFDTSINNLMQMYQSQIKDRSINLIENKYEVSRNRLQQQFKVSKYPGEDHSKEYYLVAHQLLTKGTYVPYYGTSLVQMNGNTSGYHLTPFKSCNIADHSHPGPSSVCTGSTSNKTIEGLRTLHHANLGSPYEHSCMTELSKPYADACIAKSFSIFQAAKII